jgi:hypothetical protein
MPKFWLPHDAGHFLTVRFKQKFTKYGQFLSVSPNTFNSFRLTPWLVLVTKAEKRGRQIYSTEGEDPTHQPNRSTQIRLFHFYSRIDRMRKGRTRTIKPGGKWRRGNVDFRIEVCWINEEVKEGRGSFGLCFSAASGHSPSVKSFRQHPLLSLANLSRTLA